MKYRLTFEVTDTDSWANRNLDTDRLRDHRAVEVGSNLAKMLTKHGKEVGLEFVMTDWEVEE